MQLILLPDFKLSCNLVGITVGCPCRDNNVTIGVKDLKLYAFERIAFLIDLDYLYPGRCLFIADRQLVNDLIFFLCLNHHGIDLIGQFITGWCFNFFDVILLTARVFFCSNRLTVTVGFRKLIHQIQTFLIRK